MEGKVIIIITITINIIIIIIIIIVVIIIILLGNPNYIFQAWMVEVPFFRKLSSNFYVPWRGRCCTMWLFV